MAALSFALAVLFSRTVFERLPHLEDELAYLYQARVFASGHLTVDTPSPSLAYWQPFVVDYDGQRFGKYSPGWPATLAVGEALGAAWLINAWLAALTVALVYRLAREIYCAEAGAVAAVLVAFSPAALLLNASLMGHTSALFFTTLFLMAIWRFEREQFRLRWAALAGLALGMVLINRPLTAVGVAIPFAGWYAFRLLASLFQRRYRAAVGIALMGVLVVGVGLAIPAFNAAATGDPARNLYTLVWDYDHVGFGECCGRNVHRLEKALIHTRYDLSLSAVDLFGWQIGVTDASLFDHLRTASTYWPHIGLSFVLFPLGMLLGAGPHGRRAWGLLVLWLAGALAWVLAPFALPVEATRDPALSWAWVLGALLWLQLPILASGRDPARRWTWMLASLALGLVVVQMTYWIGSQRYSTRYYFEALSAAAILSALPIAWVIRRVSVKLGLGLLLLVTAWGFFTHSLPRLQALHAFNGVNRAALEAVDARRPDDRPVLVIVRGSLSGEDRVSWRAIGSLLAVTWPLLDSDVVVARDYGTEPGVRESILQRFPDRFVIEAEARGDDFWFIDDEG
jgi:4-amino-4-deoxy-L-arabinose transferase-like glycosyltransferase